MKIIIALLLAFPIITLAAVRPDTVQVAPNPPPCATLSCTPRPNAPVIQTEIASSGGGAVSYFERRPEELAWNRVVNLSLVKLTDKGLVQVGHNYFIHPDYISYWAYQMAKEL